MRFSTVFSAVFLLSACGGSNSSPSDPASPVSSQPGQRATAGNKDSAKDGAPAGENVTAEIRAMNSDEYLSPPTTFRKGHVKPKRPPKVAKTKYGFEVRFASKAPVVTPAVYQGNVYVSGGFRSKEFHAFGATTGKSKWSVQLDDDGPSSPACESQVCVFNTESCTIFAVDAETGKELWSWWLGDPLTDAPTIADGVVFTSYPVQGGAVYGKNKPEDRAQNGQGQKRRPPKATHALAAFDLRTGKILWQRWIDSSVMSAPVATDEFVYVTTFAGTLIKLEQKTGTIRYAVRARATSAPVINFTSGGVESMYYTRRGEDSDEQDGAEEMIIRADHNDPETKYRTKRKKARYLDKKVQERSDYNKKGSADDAANGFSDGAPEAANPEAAFDNVGQSSVSNMQAFQGSRILHLGDRNVNTMGDEVIATDTETGDTLWSYKLPGNIDKSGGSLGTAPLAAGGSIVFATLQGDIVQLDPQNGQVKKTYKIGAEVRTQPVVSKGWIYVGTRDGRLIAINTRDRALTGWPMWGGNAARTGIRMAK